MSFAGETAYITGGASGIGRALATMLASKGVKVVIADRNFEGAKEAATALGESVSAVEVDAADWDSQAKGFESAIKTLGRIDYVFSVAGIFEQSWLPNVRNQTEFKEPNLAPFDVNATGALYTAALGIQQFHRQQPGKYGFRGKVVIVSSGAGFHYVPAMPIYTASKHAIVGLVRSMGVTLPEQKITLNAICPGIVKTGISGGDFYDRIEKAGMLVPMESVMAAFESLMGASPTSGETVEILAGTAGFKTKEGAPYTNDKCKESCEMVIDRANQAAAAAAK